MCFPMNFATFLRTSFLQDTSELLLVKCVAALSYISENQYFIKEIRDRGVFTTLS